MKFPNFDELMQPRREIIYTPDFKEFIHDNPGVIASFKEIEKQIEARLKDNQILPDDEFEHGDLKVSLLEFTHPAKLGWYLKAEIAGQEFFIKRVPGFFSNKDSMGVREFESTERLAELLKENDFNDVRVVDFQIGYQNNETGNTYFVSKWLNLPRVKEYLARKLKESDYFGHKKVHDRSNEIDDFLDENGFTDTSTANMFYDPKTETFYLYDVFPRDILNL